MEAKTLTDTQGEDEGEALPYALADTLAEMETDNFLRDSG